jgi:hypothetical protein
LRYDAESLVAKSLSRHGVDFEHAVKNGYLDRLGIDFKIYLEEEKKIIDLQVKTSDHGITAGLILPLPAPPIAVCPHFSETMLARVFTHMRKHPNVRYMLFVARIGKRKPEEVILSDIWRETRRIFLQAA